MEAVTGTGVAVDEKTCRGSRSRNSRSHLNKCHTKHWDHRRRSRHQTHACTCWCTARRRASPSPAGASRPTVCRGAATWGSAASAPPCPPSYGWHQAPASPGRVDWSPTGPLFLKPVASHLQHVGARGWSVLSGVASQWRLGELRAGDSGRCMHVWLFFGNFGDRPFRSRPSRSSSVLPRGRRTGATGPTWPTAPRTLWRAVRREGRREGSNSDEDLWHDWTMPSLRLTRH